jgi:Fe-S-cluster-containing hydrogenase component 2
MAFFHSDARQIYCVQCKLCHRNIPAGATEQPKKYIAVKCILCGESRLYLPTEVGLDYPHHEVAQRTR